MCAPSYLSVIAVPVRRNDIIIRDVEIGAIGDVVSNQVIELHTNPSLVRAHIMQIERVIVRKVAEALVGA